MAIPLSKPKSRIEGGVRVDYKTGAPIAQSTDTQSRNLAISLEGLNQSPKPIQVPGTPPSTAPSFANTLSAQGDAMARSLEAKTAAAEQNKNASLEALIGAAMSPGKTELTSKAYSQNGGVDQLDTELNDINSKILQEQEALRKTVEGIQTRAGVSTKAERDNQIAELERVSLRKQADLAVIQLAKQGQYDSAKEIADRAIAVQLERDTQRNNILSLIYEDNKDIFSKAEQREFETKQEERNRQLANEEYRLRAEFDQKINQNDPLYQAQLAKARAEVTALNANPLATGDAPLYSGLSSPTATAVRAKVNDFKSEPVVTNYATIQEGRNFAGSLSDDTKNPADDQALIYALAKALDPGSVVREGEYATAQKYAQSLVASYGKAVTQAINGTGFLSKDARRNIKDTIEARYKASEKSYQTLQGQYVKGINALTGRADGQKFITDYTVPQISTPEAVEIQQTDDSGRATSGSINGLGFTITYD